MTFLGRSLLAAGLLFGTSLPGACTFPEYDFAGTDATGGDGGDGGIVNGGGGFGGDSSTGGNADAGSPSTGGSTPSTCPEPTDDGCGGPSCPSCANERSCDVNEDCASRHCHPIDQVCRPGLVVRCRCTENCNFGLVATSKMEFRFQNLSSEAIPLEGMVVRYFYEPGADTSVAATCAASELENGCESFMRSQRTYTPSLPTATHVFELQPLATSGSVPAASESGWTHIELNALESGSTNQLTHYSFYSHNEPAPDPGPVVDCERITLHRATGEMGGVLVWGIPPEAVAGPAMNLSSGDD